MPDIAEIKGLKLLIVVVNRGDGKKVEKILKKMGTGDCFICLGYGTVPEEIMELLGGTFYKKDVVFCVVNAEDRDVFFEVLERKMKLGQSGKGIAVSIPLTGVDSSETLYELLNV